MSSRRILGLVLLAVGAIVLGLGLNASVSDTLDEGLTGRYTDTTTWYIVGGAGLSLAGAGLVFFGGRRVRTA